MKLKEIEITNKMSQALINQILIVIKIIIINKKKPKKLNNSIEIAKDGK